jgi:hypothetical protein
MTSRGVSAPNDNIWIYVVIAVIAGLFAGAIWRPVTKIIVVIVVFSSALILVNAELDLSSAWQAYAISGLAAFVAFHFWEWIAFLGALTTPSILKGIAASGDDLGEIWSRVLASLLAAM